MPIRSPDYPIDSLRPLVQTPSTQFILEQTIGQLPRHSETILSRHKIPHQIFPQNVRLDRIGDSHRIGRAGVLGGIFQWERAWFTTF